VGSSEHGNEPSGPTGGGEFHQPVVVQLISGRWLASTKCQCICLCNTF
jgi:hypothetical protein